MSTPEDVAALLGVSFTPEQVSRASRLLDMADAIIGQYVTGLATDVVTDDVSTPSATYTDILYLPYRPVTAAEVTIDGEAFDAFTTTARGELIRTDGRVWCGTIEVTATYGPTGDDVGWVAADMVRNAWVNPGGLTAQTIGQQSAAFDTTARGLMLTDAHRAVLGEYRPRVATV